MSQCHRALGQGDIAVSLSPAGCHQVLDESQVSLSFQEWLGSVTERIHQTMHYQFEGESPSRTCSFPWEVLLGLVQVTLRARGGGSVPLPHSDETPPAARGSQRPEEATEVP